MDQKDELYYLLRAFLRGEYDIRTFCDAFYDVYYPDRPIKFMDEEEFKCFDKLANVISRYTPFEDDIKACPNAFYSKNDVNKLLGII